MLIFHALVLSSCYRVAVRNFCQTAMFHGKIHVLCDPKLRPETRNPKPGTGKPRGREPETRNRNQQPENVNLNLMVLNREASIPIDRSEFPHLDEVEQLIEKHFKIKEGLNYGMDVDAKLYTIELPNERVLSFPTFWLEDLPDEGPGRIDFYIRMMVTYGWEEWE